MQLIINHVALLIVKQVSISPHTDELGICGENSIEKCTVWDYNKLIIYHMFRVSSITEKLGFQCENAHWKSIKSLCIYEHMVMINMM